MSEEAASYNYTKSPNHYKNGDKEVWEMMIDLFGIEAFLNFCRLNSFKYRMRAGQKPNEPIERDIEKALWYEEKYNHFQKVLRLKNLSELGNKDEWTLTM